MLDNVYELKQRFVGFNKVKLLTVVFYCMAYSWCSFLTEYSATEEQKSEWTVVGDAVVYRCDGFTVKYTWNEEFWNFISVPLQGNNPFPAGYGRASRLVEFLYRFHNALGIEVDEEFKYIVVGDKELPGCCRSCCKGGLEGKTLYHLSEINELGDRILAIKLAQGSDSNESQKRWYGNAGVISIDEPDASKFKRKNVLTIIANLFKPEAVDESGVEKLVLSDSVTKLINEKKPGYTNVSFDDAWSLKGVIVVEMEDNESI